MFKKNSSSAVLIVKNAILHREYSIFHIFMYEIPILTLQIHNLNPQALKEYQSLCYFYEHLIINHAW
jgi:hypothetical protein